MGWAVSCCSGKGDGSSVGFKLVVGAGKAVRHFRRDSPTSYAYRNSPRWGRPVGMHFSASSCSGFQMSRCEPAHVDTEVLSQPMYWRVVGGAGWRSTSVSAAVLQGPRSPSSLRLARSGFAYGLGCSLEGGGRRGGGGGGLEARVGWGSPSEPASRGLFWRAASPQGA